MFRVREWGSLCLPRPMQETEGTRVPEVPATTHEQRSQLSVPCLTVGGFARGLFAGAGAFRIFEFVVPIGSFSLGTGSGPGRTTEILDPDANKYSELGVSKLPDVADFTDGQKLIQDKVCITDCVNQGGAKPSRPAGLEWHSPVHDPGGQRHPPSGRWSHTAKVDSMSVIFKFANFFVEFEELGFGRAIPAPRLETFGFDFDIFMFDRGPRTGQPPRILGGAGGPSIFEVFNIFKYDRGPRSGQPPRILGGAGGAFHFRDLQLLQARFSLHKRSKGLARRRQH